MYFLFILSFLGCGKTLYSFTNNSKTNKIKVRNLTFNELKAKVKLSFENGDTRIKAKASIRCHKDSIIWAHISVLSYEGARLMIEKTGISFMDRINKKAYKYSYDYLSNKYNFSLSYPQIENLLLGNLQLLPNSKLPILVKENEKTKQYKIQVNDYSSIFEVQADSLTIKSAKYLQLKTNKELSVKYLSYKLFENFLLPAKVSVDFTSKDKEVNDNLKVQLKFIKIEVPKKPLKFPYSVSEKYEHIEKL